MSDEEYAEEWPSDNDNDDNQDQADDGVEIENNFYEAEGMLKENPAEAIERFETVILLEE